MDFSEGYIKMCEKAKEIQKLWEPQAWDWFAVKKGWDDKEYYDWRKHATCYAVWIISGYETDSGYYGPSFDEMEEEEYKEHCIWLPRQDQLQEMLIGDYGESDDKSYILLYKDFVSFLEKVFNEWEDIAEKTPEKAWLAFVMYKRYGKRWNDWNNVWEMKENA